MYRTRNRWREQIIMPQSERLEASIRSERRCLQKARDKAVQSKTEIDQELDAIERELAAIDAYEKAKGAGRGAAAKRGSRKRAAKRGPRGAKRAQVLEVVSEHADGLSRGEILISSVPKVTSRPSSRSQMR